MDGNRFDTTTRSLVTGSSRRALLRGVAASALVAFGLKVTSATAAPGAKANVCHYDPATGRFRSISISVKALDNHLAHGDDSNAHCAPGTELHM